MDNTVNIELAEANKQNALKPYTTPVLTKAGSLAELTQGFAGSVPDEQGGQTKRNPFQG
jgi:hypothetical protein